MKENVYSEVIDFFRYFYILSSPYKFIARHKPYIHDKENNENYPQSRWYVSKDARNENCCLLDWLSYKW